MSGHNSGMQGINKALQLVASTTKSDSLEERLLEEICSMFSQGVFYYSRTYDLTNSLERSSMEGGVKIDARFLWNHFLAEPFTAVDPRMLTRLMQGFIQIEPCEINNASFTYALISR